ncbi:MAG TPA: glycosyltransferase [Candidatus Paceibacterota bacterium]|nr:glycosyltransferase [Candidatus Paceibacterota bacterium]
MDTNITNRIKKRLLMISTDRKIFEVGSAVRARQTEYAKNYDEVHIIVFAKGKHETQNEIVITSNCWAYSTQSLSRWLYAFDALRLAKFIVAKRSITDITCQDPFQTASVGVSLKKQFPLIQLELQVHTDIGSPHFTYTWGNKIRKTLALSYLPKADHIRVVSNKIKKYLIEILKIEDSKIEVRPVAVDTSKIKNAPIIPSADLHAKYPQFEKIVLMASRIEKEKNFELAIKSFAEVVKKIPKAGLIIVGEGSQVPMINNQCSKLGLNNFAVKSVIFESWADQQTLYSYYKTADVFLVTSLFEGYGMTLVEAHAAACKIVSTDVGVAREIDAIIVRDDPQSVSEGVIGIIS